MGPGTLLWTIKLATTSSKDEQIQKGISCNIEGYNVIIIKISKRSARQHYSACAKHSAGLKSMKRMKFSFRTTINTENSRSYIS